MLVRMEMVGEGTSESPYRVNFPTWSGIHFDYDNGYIIVDIPDITHPRIDIKRGIVKEHLTVTRDDGSEVTHRNVVTAVSPSLMQAWYDHLDRVYQEHAGRFRHKVV